jgi:hypothetical protein
MARDLVVIRFLAAMVHKMHLDEAWHKGTRVHHFVPLEDPEVVERVATIIEEQGNGLLDHALQMLGLACRAA